MLFRSEMRCQYNDIKLEFLEKLVVSICNKTVSYTHLPDELDTRFSKFSEADDDFTDLGNAGQPPVIKGAADILELDVYKRQL